MVGNEITNFLRFNDFYSHTPNSTFPLGWRCTCKDRKCIRNQSNIRFYPIFNRSDRDTIDHISASKPHDIFKQAISQE